MGKWIVRNGVDRFLEEFDPDSVTVERGVEVIGQAERGTDAGFVRFEGNDKALAIIAETTFKTI